MLELVVFVLVFVFTLCLTATCEKETGQYPISI